MALFDFLKHQTQKRPASPLAPFGQSNRKPSLGMFGQSSRTPSLGSFGQSSRTPSLGAFTKPTPLLNSRNQASGVTAQPQATQPFAQQPRPSQRAVSPSLSGMQGFQLTPQPQIKPEFQNQLDGLRQTALGLQQQVNRPQPTTPQPTAPTPAVPDTASKIQEAEQQLMQSMEITPDEVRTQADLDKLISSTRQAFTGTQDKTIPMEFITGQLASIENRALNLAEPLESKLSRLQAKREASQSASRFALERLEKRAEAEKTKPAEGFTLGEGQTRFDAQGNVVARGGLAGGTGGESAVSPQAQAWADLISQGRADISNVPNDMRDAVASVLATKPQGTPAQIDDLKTKISDIEMIMNHPGLDSRVGPNALARGAFAVQDRFGAGDDFAGSVQQLVSQETIDTLLNLKKEGGTLGALSDEERKMLERAATKISGWEVKDANGFGTGRWDIDEENFKKELTRIQDLTRTALEQAGGTDESRLYDTFLNSLPDDILRDADPGELEELFRQSGFNNVGSDTNTALNLPQRNNNPGNVKRGGIADKFALKDPSGNPLTDKQGHLVFGSPDQGFQALASDLRAKMTGNSSVVGANPTISQLGRVYAEDKNWPNSVAKILGVDVNTRIGTLDFNRLVQAIARQEGFYA